MLGGVLGALLSALVFIASSSFANAPSDLVISAVPAEEVAAFDPTLDLDRLNGRWTIDWKASDSFEPVMDALEVPWLLRRLAGVVKAYITITVESPPCDTCNPSLRIEQESPVRDSSRVVRLDGVARPSKDPLGNETVDRFDWTPETGMELIRVRTLGSGRTARILERRVVEDDLRTMVSTMTVWVDDVERAQVRRVLRKVKP
jgi:hypothetical protein